MNTAILETPAAPIALAHRAAEPATLALAGVIAAALGRGRRPLIRGLSEDRFRALLDAHFAGLTLVNGSEAPAPGGDEFADLLELLLEFRACPDEPGAWLAHAVATAAMGENHLWQDMGLPNRKVLSQLMKENFPALAAKNVGDMKWKKFFYRQLCERAEVPICKSPHCAECCDYGVCFGGED